MTRLLPWVWVATALLPSSVSAQVLIDMNRLTCAQYVALPPDQSRLYSAWMSGWFNQRTGYAWIDLAAYQRNIVSVKQWCTTSPGDTVMRGLERATTR